MRTIVLDFKSSSRYPVTRQRLRKMLKWFMSKGEEVKITYEYNNSNAVHQVRQNKGIIESFEVKTIDYGAGKEFGVIVHFESGQVMQECLGDYWEFTGLGKLQMCNSGPYCNFTVEFTYPDRNQASERS